MRLIPAYLIHKNKLLPWRSSLKKEIGCNDINEQFADPKVF